MFRRHFFKHAAATTAFCMTGCRPHVMFHGNPKLREKMGKAMIDHLSEELDLTRDQKTKVEQIHTEIKAKHDEMCERKQSVMSEFLNEMKKDSLYQQKLAAMMDEKYQHFESLKPFILEKITEFHAILTSEQRAKLATKLEEFHNHHSDGCCH